MVDAIPGVVAALPDALIAIEFANHAVFLVETLAAFRFLPYLDAHHPAGFVVTIGGEQALAYLVEGFGFFGAAEFVEVQAGDLAQGRYGDPWLEWVAEVILLHRDTSCSRAL